VYTQADTKQIGMLHAELAQADSRLRNLQGMLNILDEQGRQYVPCRSCRSCGLAASPATYDKTGRPTARPLPLKTNILARDGTKICVYEGGPKNAYPTVNMLTSRNLLLHIVFTLHRPACCMPIVSCICMSQCIRLHTACRASGTHICTRSGH